MTIHIRKEFPDLFKRTKTGNIQFWRIYTLNNTLVKTAGKLGTSKPLVHEEIVQGKNIGKSNETTGAEQAALQAESDWKKKRDEGYKSLKDLGLVVVTAVEDADAWTKQVSDANLESMLLQHLPEFNTDAQGRLKPMKAPTNPWKKSPKNKYPKIMEPKLDGNRCTVQITVNQGQASAKILSKSGKQLIHLSHLQEILEGNYYGDEDLILDGEIYLHGLLLEEINEAIKAPNENTPKLQFHVYDLPLSTELQFQRSAKIAGIVAMYYNHKDFIQNVVSRIVNSDEEVLQLHDEFVSQEYEGGMLKDPNGTYEPGVRSSYWTKVKMFDDSEFVIIDFALGQRGVEDLIAICECRAGTFEVTMNGNLAYKQKLWDDKANLIGKMLTVKHFGYTKYGIPNLAKGKNVRYD